MNGLRGTPKPVILLNLLEDPDRFDDERLSAAVQAGLAPHGVTSLPAYRFLVLDTPEGPVGHHAVYERLLSYERSSRTSVLCVLCGDLDGGMDPDKDSPALRRPGLLRTTSVGLLWAGDLKGAGHRGGPRGPAASGGVPDTQALGALTRLLRVPEIFDRVLQRLDASCNGVAAPGVRLLEYDLSEKARDRAWEKGAARAVGRPSEGHDVTGGSTGADHLPTPLDQLAGGGAGGSAEYTRSGPLEERRARCVGALRAAGEAKKFLATVGGLADGHAADTFTAAVSAARSALGDYRDQVSALVELGARPPWAIEPEEAGLQLKEAGVFLPPAGITTDRVGEALAELAGRLFGEGLTLRAVADRFEDCSARMMPHQDETLAAEPDQACPPNLLRVGGGARPTTLAGGWPARTLTFLGGGLAGLGEPPWAAGAILVVLLALYGGSRVSRRLPVDAPRVRASFGRRYLLAQGAAALVGGALAGLAGTRLGLAAWGSLLGLVLGLVLAAAAVVQDWRRAVAEVWKASGAAGLQSAVRALDKVLDRAVKQRWWAERERTGGAESARSVAVVLSTVADIITAEAAAGVGSDESVTDFGPEAWDTGRAGADRADDPGADVPSWIPRAGPDGRATKTTVPGGSSGTGPGAAGDDPLPLWLDRESGDGGPELVATVAADFTDLALHVLEPYWESLRNGHTAAGSERLVAKRVREQLDIARRNLLLNGIVPAPDFAAPSRARGGLPGLLGLSLDPVAEAGGPDADRDRVVRLVSPRQVPLLSRDPTAAVWIRFAPEAVREQLDRRGGGTDMGAVWTSSGRYAGQLRLTPLRSGSVRTVPAYSRTEDEATEDTAAAATGPAGHRADGPDSTAHPAGPREAANPPEHAEPYPWKDPSHEEHTW